MSAHGLVTSFWDAAVAPAGMEESVAKLRELIRRNQQPERCTDTCRMSRRIPTSGAMQNQRRIAMALLQAVVRNCTFVPGWPKDRHLPLATSPTLRDACDSTNRTGLNCYFLPASSCSSPHGSSGSSLQLITNWNSSAGLDVIARWTGLRSELLIMGTLLSWLMRPQPELVEALQWYGGALGLGGGARHRRVAMHLRRGDKYSLHSKHMRNHSWRIHPESFALWGRRVAASLGAERVLYMTDDRSVDLRARFGPLFELAPAPHTCAPSSHTRTNLGELKRHQSSATTYRNIIAQEGASPEPARGPEAQPGLRARLTTTELHGAWRRRVEASPAGARCLRGTRVRHRAVDR